MSISQLKLISRNDLRNSKKDFPEVAQSKYEKARNKTVHRAGPLNEKTRALIKLANLHPELDSKGLFIHIHEKLSKPNAQKQKLSKQSCYALPTIGFPATMAVLSWVEDIIEKK
ncbi:MAG: carboxymuconolactone decarboxylase family protein [Ignavibacteriaceae bacterium]|nr:carboxymuconolactone decarboxylase family protein [Ignavibacteriaceae bacterium]